MRCDAGSAGSVGAVQAEQTPTDLAQQKSGANGIELGGASMERTLNRINFK